MKQFLLLTMLLATVFNDSITSDFSEEEAMDSRLREIRSNCIDVANVSDGHIILVYKHRIFNLFTDAANTPKELQCFSACNLKELGIFENDKPNMEFLRENVPLLINDKKKADAVVDKCTKLKGEDNCEIAFNFELCMVQETTLTF